MHLLFNKPNHSFLGSYIGLKEFFEISTLSVVVFCKWNIQKMMDCLSSSAYLNMTK